MRSPSPVRTCFIALTAAVTAWVAACGDSATGPRVNSLRILPASAVLEPGETVEFTAQALDGGGNVLPDRAGRINWRVLNPSLATLEADRDVATVTALDLGLTFVVAELSSAIRRDAEVFVQPPGLASVEIEPDTLTIVYLGPNGVFDSRLLDESGEELSRAGFRFQWNLLDTTMARITNITSDGATNPEARVQALEGVGRTTLRLRVGRDFATADVRVRLESLRPAAPSVITLSSSSLDVSWDRPSGTRDGYRVLRSTSPDGEFTEIAAPGRGDPFGSSVTSYTDTGLTPGTTYYYKITACNEFGCSEPSPVGSGTTAAEGAGGQPA